jgi:hypothetical protein
MSDRLAWLQQWCPECCAAPGARCKRQRYGQNDGAKGAVISLLHLLIHDEPWIPLTVADG